MNNRRPYLILAICAIAAIVATVSLFPSRTRSAPTPAVIMFNNELPSAFGGWEVVKADTIAVLVDATKDKVMGEIPEVALTGKTVKITCKASRFSVSRTVRGEARSMIVHMPGEVVELTDNGQYTVLLVTSDEIPKPTAVSYVVKMDQAELDEMMDLLKKPDSQPAKTPKPPSSG